MVVSVVELFQKRRSSTSDGRERHVRHWQVVCDSAMDGPAAALKAPGVPRYDDPLSGSSARVTSVEADPVNESDVVFEVTAEWTSDTDIEQFPIHPLDRRPEFNYGANEFTEAYFYDETRPTRKPFVNSVGDAFDSTWERDKADTIINMARNEATFNVVEADEWKNTTNANVVILDGQGYAIDTLRLGPLTAAKTAEVWMGLTVEFYRVGYIFKARKQGWKDKPLDYGYNELIEKEEIVNGVPTLVKKRMPILGYQNGKLTRPWPLDGVGKKMLHATDTPAELEFCPYQSVSWAGLYLS